MTYLRDRPLASEQLKTSQPVILNNFNDADTYFAVDHYAFSDNNANSGKHQSVTNPVVPGTTTHQSTAADEPKIYGMTVGATNNNSVIQWSRGPSDAVPTPLTKIQSSNTPFSIGASSTVNIYDFTGMNDVFGLFTYANMDSAGGRIVMGKCNLFYISSTQTLQIKFLSRAGTVASIYSQIEPSVSGRILRLKNDNTAALDFMEWTLDFLRIRV